MSLVYVAAPLRATTATGVWLNIQNAFKCAGIVLRAGHTPLVAHGYAIPGCLDPFSPDQDAIGRAAGIRLLKECREVWCFGPLTPGMRAEVAFAVKHGKRVRYFDAKGQPA